MSRFVISITDFADPSKKNYLYHDRDCGYLMGGSLSNAKQYTDFDECLKDYNQLLTIKPHTMIDGTRFPPSFIHTGLGICNVKPKAEGAFCIERIEPVIVMQTIVQGEIQKPKGYVY